MSERWHDRGLIDLLGIEHPILLAPMAGATNAELVAAVSETGALGSYGAASTRPDALRNVIRQVRQLTPRPFNVNLFAPDTEQWDRAATLGPGMRAQLDAYHREFDLGPTPDPEPMFGPFDGQLEVLIDERVPVVSFHFGAPPEAVRAVHETGAKVLCSATTVVEARALVEAGVDVVIAQGAEAGGHRGTFDGPYQHALIGTLALVPQIVDAVPVPVIAAGGIMDARGVAAALALGASGVQMGTAFLAAAESPIAAPYQDRVLRAGPEQTTVTEVLSGKPARGIRNRYVEEMTEHEHDRLPYPAQYSVSRVLRTSAAERGDPDFMAMWAGQAVGLARAAPAAELIGRILEELPAVRERIPSG